jgi:hypothetical protein
MLNGDRSGPLVAGNVGREMRCQRFVQADRAAVDEPQHGVGKDRFAQRRCFEDRVIGDRRRGRAVPHTTGDRLRYLPGIDQHQREAGDGACRHAPDDIELDVAQS